MSARESVVFDCETAPIAESISPFDPAEVKFGNTKDPEKVKARIEEARSNYQADAMKAAALSATTGRILAVGMAFEDGTQAILEGEEALILRDIWNIWALRDGARWIGFNCHRFDVPFMMRRSWINGVPVPSDVMDGRYQNSRFIDLYDLWMCGARDSENGSAKLDTIARCLGVGQKNGDGATFAEVYAKDPEAAREYLRNDLKLTLGVARKMGVIHVD